jgi:hypothetical protein
MKDVDLSRLGSSQEKKRRSRMREGPEQMSL